LLGCLLDMGFLGDSLVELLCHFGEAENLGVNAEEGVIEMEGVVLHVSGVEDVGVIEQWDQDLSEVRLDWLVIAGLIEPFISNDNVHGHFVHELLQLFPLGTGLLPLTVGVL